MTVLSPGKHEKTKKNNSTTVALLYVRNYAIYYFTHNVTMQKLLYNTPVFVRPTHPWLDRVDTGGRIFHENEIQIISI